MSRSGYNEDSDDQWGLIRWRGAVRSAIKGKRGQAFLLELRDALDAMPEKRLVSDELQADGDFCTLGVTGAARGLPLERIDTEDWSQLSAQFGISEALAREIMYENDQDLDDWRWQDVEIFGPVRRYETHQRSIRVDLPNAAERRWSRMRAWVQSQLTAT